MTGSFSPAAYTCTHKEAIHKMENENEALHIGDRQPASVCKAFDVIGCLESGVAAWQKTGKAVEK